MTLLTDVGANAHGTRDSRDGTAVDKAVDPASADLASRTAVVSSAAAKNAVAIDRDARFPREAFDAARSQRLLGIMVPEDLGGEGASISAVADICYALGRACSSTGMIYAMHQVKVACVVKHGRGSAWHNHLLRRLASEQLLLASSTTEGEAGGNIRSSAAPVENRGTRIALERRATVISYGEYADGIVTTARRSPDAPASDQVLAVFLKDDYSLETINSWDTLGMRGTCSSGFILRASGGGDQLLPVSYDKIHTQTMVPTAHLLWSSVWAGVAAGALDRAQAFIRGVARKSGGQPPPATAHFTKAKATLGTLRGMLASSLRRYEAISHDEAAVASLEYQAAIGLTKVEASELAVSIVLGALRAGGLTSYRNDSEFGIGRHLRDILSSPIMINNDRILSNVAATSLMSAVPAGLRDQRT